MIIKEQHCGLTVLRVGLVFRVGFAFLSESIYQRHSALMCKYNIGLKIHLQEFYSDLVCKIQNDCLQIYNFRENKNAFYPLQKYRLKHSCKAQTTCMIVNIIMVDNLAFLFNCITMKLSSD